MDCDERVSQCDGVYQQSGKVTGWSVKIGE